MNEKKCKKIRRMIKAVTGGKTPTVYGSIERRVPVPTLDNKREQHFVMVARQQIVVKSGFRFLYRQAKRIEKQQTA